MNINFNKIKKDVSKAAFKAKEVSENVVEIAKSKFKLSEIYSDVEEKYAQIGKLVYKSDETENISEDVQKLCDEITDLLAVAGDLSDTINNISNKKQCPECEENINKDFMFCPKCGYKFDEE